MCRGDAAESLPRSDRVAQGTCGGGDGTFGGWAGGGGRCGGGFSVGRNVQFSADDDDVRVHLGIGLFEGGLADAELLGDLGESLALLNGVSSARSGGGFGRRAGGGFGGAGDGLWGGRLNGSFGRNFEGLPNIDAVGFKTVELHDLARTDAVVHRDAPDSIAWADGVVGGGRERLDRSFG